MGEVAANLKTVLQRMAAAYEVMDVSRKTHVPRLVAVSKTKPVEAVVTAYESGQRHFGENHVKELLAKSNDAAIVSKCPEIQWHLIGPLQHNKVGKLMRCVKNLYVVETVQSTTIAEALNAALVRARTQSEGAGTDCSTLKVMIQVNTSGEAQKSGVKPDEAEALCDFITSCCPCLELAGLMTIGSYEHSTSDDASAPNPDFETLFQTRERICKSKNWPLTRLELSMGMSHDFEKAVSMGSTNVRVGSLIFGAREYKTSG